MVTIAHISDMHVGSVHFVPNLMNRAIQEINELGPDLVVATGDFTNDGFRDEYKTAAAYLSQIEAPVHSVPGNHDERNVGYVHFEELIGPRHWTLRRDGLLMVGADSAEPDLDYGQIGRERYGWLVEELSPEADLKIYVQHHHLLPVPGTGRERNIVNDAGDLLELLIRSGVNLVLTGHKHVPWLWRLENLYVVNTGTVSSLRVRGHTRPCYKVIEFDAGEVRVYRRIPFGESTLVAHWNVATGEEYYRELEPVPTDHAPAEDARA